jgi:hypothetical protein
MRVNFSIVPGVLLAVTCGIAAPALAQSALERLERQIRQRAAGADRDQSDVAKPVPPPPAVGQVGSPPHAAPYLGIRADDQKDRGRGVRLLDVYRGSPADKAGLHRQDLITAIAGVRVRQMTDLSDILDNFAPGQAVDFDLLREGKPERARVTLGERQAAAGQPTAPPEVIPLPPGETAAGPPAPPPPGTSSATDASRIDRLERRVEELERRVAELERQLAAARKVGRTP